MYDQTFIDQAKLLLDEKKGQLRNKQNQIVVLQNECIELLNTISAFQVVLKDTAGPSDITDTDDTLWIRNLQNKTHKDKVILIAQHNNGLIKPKEIVKILVDNQLTTATKLINVHVTVNSTLKELEKEHKIKKMKRGEYQLIQG
jgi:hypothetical protein